MEPIDIIKTRTSIRSYTNESVAYTQIQDIVYAAQHAPNAGPFFTSVVTDSDLLAEIDEAVYQSMINSEGFGKERASLPGYRPLYGAPVLVIFSSEQENPFGAINTACACTAASLAASALGLGSCYIMAPKVAFELIPDLGKKLKLPEGYTPDNGLLVGHTDDPKLFVHKFGEQEPAVFI